MKNIKTTTCIMVLFVLLITGKSCLAEKINVYDGNFCDMYNFIVQSQFMGSDSEKNLISIKEERMKILTTGGMLLHCYPLNNVVNGNGTFIVCHIGNNGGVCQIDIVNNMMATKEDARNAYVAILKVLDVSDQDIEFFTDLHEPKYKRISNERILVAAFKPAKEQPFETFVIAAFDK